MGAARYYRGGKTTPNNRAAELDAEPYRALKLFRYAPVEKTGTFYTVCTLVVREIYFFYRKFEGFSPC